MNEQSVYWDDIYSQSFDFKKIHLDQVKQTPIGKLVDKIEQQTASWIEETITEEDLVKMIWFQKESDEKMQKTILGEAQLELRNLHSELLKQWLQLLWSESTQDGPSDYEKWTNLAEWNTDVVYNDALLNTYNHFSSLLSEYKKLYPSQN